MFTKKYNTLCLVFFDPFLLHAGQANQGSPEPGNIIHRGKCTQ